MQVEVQANGPADEEWSPINSLRRRGCSDLGPHNATAPALGRVKHGLLMDDPETGSVLARKRAPLDRVEVRKFPPLLNSDTPGTPQWDSHATAGQGP